ncbi:hypothetical protein Axi01nite_70180 [Actinoplanes xinjiangensis]|nr:hypothetical protein Axi01nite_70180 [Actinoplanes xinjiangensis]
MTVIMVGAVPGSELGDSLGPGIAGAPATGGAVPPVALSRTASQIPLSTIAAATNALTAAVIHRVLVETFMVAS